MTTTADRNETQNRRRWIKKAEAAGMDPVRLAELRESSTAEEVRAEVLALRAAAEMDEVGADGSLGLRDFRASERASLDRSLERAAAATIEAGGTVTVGPVSAETRAAMGETDTLPSRTVTVRVGDEKVQTRYVRPRHGLNFWTLPNGRLIVLEDGEWRIDSAPVEGATRRTPLRDVVRIALEG